MYNKFQTQKIFIIFYCHTAHSRETCISHTAICLAGKLYILSVDKSRLVNKSRLVDKSRLVN